MLALAPSGLALAPSGLALAGTCAKRPGTCAERPGTCAERPGTCAEWSVALAGTCAKRPGTCAECLLPSMHLLTSDQYSMEAKYQWLPTLFRVSNNGTVSAASYITNLNGSRYPEMVSGIERALSACLPLLEEVLTELRRDGAPFNMRSANPAATVDMHALWEERTAYFQRTRGKEGVDLLRSAEKNYADSQKRYHADSQKRYYTPTHKRGTVLRRLTKEVVLARVGPGGESARESHRRVLRGQTPGQSATRPSLQAAGQVAPCCVRQPPWSRSPRHS